MRPIRGFDLDPDQFALVLVDSNSIVTSRRQLVERAVVERLYILQDIKTFGRPKKTSRRVCVSFNFGNSQVVTTNTSGLQRVIDE